ncbi:hypothetical protein AgCh_038682 [Apium graveolens]
MDFITGLPKFHGKDVIFVVIDRLSKYGHFVALSHPFTAVHVAQAYLDNIFKLHGWPKSIVSDIDAIFLSDFWKHLFLIHGTDFLISSAYHPATDGQTEVVNRCLETYLRCMCGDNVKYWSLWLPLAEWWYNTNSHTATGLTPYEVVYNQQPPLHLPYVTGESSNAAVDRSLQKREDMFATLKFHLARAQCRMKNQADKHRRGNQKLSQRYFGPFQIEAVIGKVSYKLKLPAEAKIHNVFHVSLLKAFHGRPPVTISVPVLKRIRRESWLNSSKEKQREAQKAKESALEQLEEERRQLKTTEPTNRRESAALHLKIETELQNHKDELQRLELDLSGLIESRMFGGELENQLEEDITSDRNCLICEEQEVSIVFLPCAHQVLCSSCSDSYGKNGKAGCPFCGVPIQQRIQVFGAQ